MGIITNVKLLNQRRTKIPVTLGPASSDPTIIKRLVLAGANVIRMNMSHGDHASHAQCYHQVRAIAADLAVPLAIVADLCGPKIRVGKFPDGEIALVSGSEVIVTTRDVLGGPKLIPALYPGLAQDSRASLSWRKRASSCYWCVVFTMTRSSTLPRSLCLLFRSFSGGALRVVLSVF